MLRSFGRSFNDLKALLQRLEWDRRKLTRNSALAALLVTVCRRVLPVRHIDPSELRDIPASYEGYLRIADFHLFSDAGLYDFGEHGSGPNLFTRLRRNVAILRVQDCNGKVVYNTFAVSGALKTPGVSPAPPCGPLRSVEAEDEHGRLFDRRHDAEFKLLNCLCDAFEASRAARADAASTPSDSSAATTVSAPFVELEPGASSSTWKGTGRLWSRKPLCRSCLGAVRQLGLRFPHLQLEVVVGDDDEVMPSELLRPQEQPLATTSPPASPQATQVEAPAAPTSATADSARSPPPRLAAAHPEAASTCKVASMPPPSALARRSPKRPRRSPPPGWLAGQMCLAYGQHADAIGCA